MQPPTVLQRQPMQQHCAGPRHSTTPLWHQAALPLVQLS